MHGMYFNLDFFTTSSGLNDLCFSLGRSNGCLLNGNTPLILNPPWIFLAVMAAYHASENRAENSYLVTALP